MDTLEVPGLLGHVHINNFQHFKSRIAWSGPGFWKAFGALRRRFGVPSRRHPEIFTVKPLMSMSAYHWLVCSLPHLGYNLSNSLNSFTVIIWYIFDPFCSYMCSKFIYGSLINMFFFSGEVQPAQPHPARMPRSWSRPWCSKSPRSGSRRANCSSTRGSSRLQIRRRKKNGGGVGEGVLGQRRERHWWGLNGRSTRTALFFAATFGYSCSGKDGLNTWRNMLEAWWLDIVSILGDGEHR